MADIKTGIQTDSNFLNLKEIPVNKVRSEVTNLLIPGETIVQCFQTVRDQVVFTDKRVFTINVQGVTGKKVSYFSYPYSKISHFGIETAGVLDIDSELVMNFEDGTHLLFDFRSRVDIRGICSNISRYIL